ncbi:UNKNOWN [Stylonychia lemnae]|uniref:Uncharacterized protein n=1 Tax=Stylonychia lemnae TaxID=5949 RepID=A0A078ATC0_STYLE|nr:UNKNOWN [Stylonychia lemnae]|eukprot:CDW85261.1 UNKNOWN [Stylonychia lemnae]
MTLQNNLTKINSAKKYFKDKIRDKAYVKRMNQECLLLNTSERTPKFPQDRRKETCEILAEEVKGISRLVDLSELQDGQRNKRDIRKYCIEATRLIQLCKSRLNELKIKHILDNCLSRSQKQIRLVIEGFFILVQCRLVVA